MSERMTPEQVREWQRRWALVNAREIAEMRATPLEVKLQQLAALMFSVDQLGWREALQEGEEEVRARWLKLKEAYRKRLSADDGEST